MSQFIVKKCNICGEEGKHRKKKINKSGSIQYNSVCNKCDTERTMKWRATPSGQQSLRKALDKRKNSKTGQEARKRYGQKVSAHMLLLKRKALNYLGGARCNECNIEDTCLGIYDFHHLRDKKIGISIWLRSQPMSSEDISEIHSELDKCVVLCKNCHTRKHCYLDDYSESGPIS